MPHQFVPSRISLDSMKDKDLPNQKNGIYGHGKERYDKMEAIFDYEEVTQHAAWEALVSRTTGAAERKLPVIPSGLLFMMIPISPQIALRRNWEDVIGYNLINIDYIKNNNIEPFSNIIR